MANLKGQIQAYLIEESGGKVVSLATLMKITGERGETGATRVKAAVSHIKRAGERGDGLIKLKNHVPGQVWQVTNWAEIAPTGQSDAADLEPIPEPGTETAPETTEASPHVCAFEVVGYTRGDEAVPIIRNARGEIFKAVPIS
jgi:hypothetical protein